jgi:hypothetical protein
MAFDEKVIQDPELEAFLEARESVAEAHATYREKTKAAQARVKELGTEGAFRCGRFAISVSPKESRHVEFDQASRIQINFKIAKVAKE